MEVWAAIAVTPDFDFASLYLNRYTLKDLLSDLQGLFPFHHDRAGAMDPGVVMCRVKHA